MMFFIFAVVLLGVVERSIQCSPPGSPNWSPLTIAERARIAPLVIQAYLVHKPVGSTHSHSTRCLHVTTVYKGCLYPSDSTYICASRFGDGAQCLVDLVFGVQYIIFLNKLSNNGYEACYDDIHSAAVAYNSAAFSDVTRGICCPQGQDCDNRLIFKRNSCGLVNCHCSNGTTPGPKGCQNSQPPGPPGSTTVKGSGRGQVPGQRGAPSQSGAPGS